jgi:transposase
MSEKYGLVNPNQQGQHLPPVQDRLSENDPVYFILDAVTELDISPITAKYEQEQRGFPPYSPRMMVALLLYSYFRGLFSSRKIVQACQERLAFRAIVGDNVPDWRTINDFRRLHTKELEGPFVEVLELCLRAGVVKLGHIGPDGTKAKPVAGRQNGMSYCRTKKEEQRLQHKIHELLTEAEAADQQEDQQYVTDCGGRELPEHSAHRQSRLELIRRAQGALETEAKDSVKQAVADGRTDAWPDQGRRRTAILDIPADGDIRPPTWEETARKCAAVYREVISNHKNCPRR